MAIYKIFPEKDASIYSEFPDKNTGLDQILEASTYQNGGAHVSRYLVKFSDTEIDDIYNNMIGSNSYQINFRNFNVVVTGLNLDRQLELYPVSGAWNMGTGRFNDSPSTENGVSWAYKDYQGGTAWETTGGDYHLTPKQSQTFTYSDNKDVDVNVTETVDLWFNNTIPNDGFLVKQLSSNEFVENIHNNAIFRFFSIDTHTIYPPQLEFKFDDYTFDIGTSTQTVLENGENLISIYNNKEIYYRDSKPRFRVSAMPKYPDRQFLTSSLYSQNYYLPTTSSYYAVKDTATNEYVIDFDETFTRISADEESSYFDLYCKGLEPERYYTILIKTENDGVVTVFDEGMRFKVVNG